MAGDYVQLPQQGGLLPVAESLSSSCQLNGLDPDLPAALPMLAALVQAQPLLVDGRLLAPDEPQALLHLERLISNWLIRSAELISAEILSCCSSWPELRRYLLRPDLLATRNLEARPPGHPQSGATAQSTQLPAALGQPVRTAGAAL